VEITDRQKHVSYNSNYQKGKREKIKSKKRKPNLFPTLVQIDLSCGPFWQNKAQGSGTIFYSSFAPMVLNQAFFPTSSNICICSSFNQTTTSSEFSLLSTRENLSVTNAS
jgi:hypothetical protein